MRFDLTSFYLLIYFLDEDCFYEFLVFLLNKLIKIAYLVRAIDIL